MSYFVLLLFGLLAGWSVAESIQALFVFTWTWWYMVATLLLSIIVRIGLAAKNSSHSTPAAIFSGLVMPAGLILLLRLGALLFGN